MRRIKFRIYDTKRKEWVHGPGDEINLFGETIIFGEILRRPDDTAVSLDDLNDIIALQYCGLKDKNGKEIYESDFLKCSTGYIWLVQWNIFHACYQMMNANNPLVTADVIDNDNMEVVGDLYSNPELLK